MISIVDPDEVDPKTNLVKLITLDHKLSSFLFFARIHGANAVNGRSAVAVLHVLFLFPEIISEVGRMRADDVLNPRADQNVDDE